MYNKINQTVYSPSPVSTISIICTTSTISTAPTEEEGEWKGTGSGREGKDREGYRHIKKEVNSYIGRYYVV